MDRSFFQRKTPLFSCELFPPKEKASLGNMEKIVRGVAALTPDFVSITCGAGGGRSRETEAVARQVLSCGIPAAAHLTCVASTKEEISRKIDEYQADGVPMVMALRGDLPQDGQTAPGAYRHAAELVRELKANGNFLVGGACYPEGHPESATQSQDIAYLKEKVDAGCDFLVTQMFFDNNVLYRFLYKLLDAGIQVPVLAGVMPVTHSGQIDKILRLSSASLPPRFVSLLDRFGSSPEAMRQAGIAYATEQVLDLVANGVKGIHLYTMNHPDIAGEILGNLSHILRP